MPRYFELGFPKPNGVKEKNPVTLIEGDEDQPNNANAVELVYYEVSKYMKDEVTTSNLFSKKFLENPYDNSGRADFKDEKAGKQWRDDELFDTRQYDDWLTKWIGLDCDLCCDSATSDEEVHWEGFVAWRTAQRS